MNGMEPSWAIWTVIVLAALTANLPFLTDRRFVIGPVLAHKPVGWRLVEWLLYSCAVAAIGRMLETRLGQASELRWQFIAVWACVCATLAFPGFVWRYLIKR